MNLNVLEQEFSICKVSDLNTVSIHSPFVFISNTPDELSVVCPTALKPPKTIVCEDHWSCFYIAGVLDFSLIGILSKISVVLAKNNIGIFVVSTYNTDYIFVKTENLQNAMSALKEHGYVIHT